MPVDAAELLGSDQLSELLSRWQADDERFARALSSGVAPAQALAGLGARLCVQQRYLESVGVLRAACELSPREPHTWSTLAVAFERAERRPEAIEAVRRSLQIDSEQSDSWVLLGNMHRAQGDTAAAQEAYETAVKIRPDSAVAWQSLGLFRRDQRRYHDSIEAFRACASNGGASAPIYAVLGQLFHQTGQFPKALHAYRMAAELEPGNTIYRVMGAKIRFVLDVIELPSLDDAIREYQAALPPDAGAEDRDAPALLKSTFSLLAGYGQLDAAKRVGQRCLDLAPDSPSAAYLLRALTGDPGVTRAPDAYLVEHFNTFADGFDLHLTSVLDYTIPQQTCHAVAPFLPAGGTLDILDAGCGTGLCAPHIHPFARTLTGVDLSPRMLAHARQRNLYTHLHCEELTAFLTRSTNSADLVLATDVLIYFGDIAPLFAACAAALRPGAFLAFSIERCAGLAYQLLPSGRFAHGPAYIRDIAARHRLVERACNDTTIRLEATTPVAGNIFVFQAEPRPLAHSY